MLPSGTCGGFPLGYPSRADSDINTKYTYLVQGRNPDAPLCQPGRQNIPGNNPFPPATVFPGQDLHLTWQPDGHLDDAHPSTIEIHWSGTPGRQLHTRSELSPSTLLGTMVFGTSANCDQPSEPNTWCHGHLTVPWNTQPGTYQMIWWWKYDRNPAGEEYSTCFEIVVPESLLQSTGIDASVLTAPLSAQVADFNVNIKSRQLEMANMISGDNGDDDRSIVTTIHAIDSFESDATPDTTQSTIGDKLRVSKALTLKDLATKPDEPLSVVPNYTINQVGKVNSISGGDYVDDETGALAGDAINENKDTDVSPIPLASPSQLINSTLTSQTKSQANSSTTTWNNADAFSNQDGTFSNSNGTNRVADVSSSRPVNNKAIENSTLDNVLPYNQTLVGQKPNFDSAAPWPMAFSAPLLMFGVLATLSWVMMV
ncbi:hypothetical protein EDD11_000532 [Mortierella claussenii]|nr:hypothetical protein EDD11_000532 [Mortierella claussenii]